MTSTSNGEPRSYWHATAPPPVPSAALPDACDVVVIGGGQVGTWTAYWLARAGADVTLIERTAISWGATGRNGGFVSAGLADGFTATAVRIGEEGAWGVWRISEQGREIVQQIIAEEGIDCDYRENGTVGLILGEDELDVKHASVNELASHGVAIEALDRASLQELIRTPLADEIAGGVFHPQNALVHSAKYLAGVGAAAQRLGARFCQANVTELQSDGDGTLVVTEQGTVRARNVVVGINAWTDELVPELTGLIVPVRGQILSYEPIPTTFTTGVGVAVTPTGEYWQQALDGSIVIGGCRDDAPNKDVGVRETVPTPDVISRIADVIPRLFPQLNGLKVARSWAGLMAFTADYLPVAGPAPGLPGVWVAGGFCGHGMPFGPRLGQLFTEAITTGSTPDALRPLSADRPTLTPVVSTVFEAVE